VSERAGEASSPTVVGEAKLRSITYGEVTWVDIVDPTTTETTILGRDYPFHPLNLEDCLSGRQLIRVESYEDYLFMTLQFPEQGPKGIILSNQLSMFVGKNYLVTLHPASLKFSSELFQICEDDEVQRRALMKSSAYLTYRIIAKLVDGMFSILDDVQSDLDDIEPLVFDERKSSATAITRVRRRIAVLRRIVFPLTLYVADINSEIKKFSVEEDLAAYFRDIEHQVRRAFGTLDEMKEMVEIYKDTDFIISSDKTSNVLNILTILFTLTIPATLISSIYGMNVPLPGGLVTGPLDWFGPYTSLLVLSIAMLIPAITMLLYFRRVGWF
jgi:magnesium transporter